MQRNNNNKNTMYLFWAIAIILCLLLVLVSLFTSSCGNTNKNTRTDPTNDPSKVTSAPKNPENPAENPGTGENPAGGNEPANPDAPPAENAGVQLGETEDAGQEYIDKLIFLGDSTTYGLKHYAVLKDGKETKQTWTPLSGTLTLSFWNANAIVYPETGEEILIAEAVEKHQPEYLVITLGVNGVSFMDEKTFKGSYTDLVNAVKAKSPNTKIICNSIYPVEAQYEAKDNGINNAKINAANGWIKQVAEATGTRYSDTASVLKNAEGFLDPANGNGDGIHLGEAGLKKLLMYLRTHAYK
ncbi:MAG: hypothetical protein GX684_00690 [Ruminococcaceae bacterium]|nr:hypothetical protein [Oscillospiraceae bacterium]